jgi:hypothetical protein
MSTGAGSLSPDDGDENDDAVPGAETGAGLETTGTGVMVGVAARGHPWSRSAVKVPWPFRPGRGLWQMLPNCFRTGRLKPILKADSLYWISNGRWSH